MGSKTSSQQNQQSATDANPQAYADYNQTIRRAKQVSNTPYTAYSGQLTAPTNAQEGTATTALNGLGAVGSNYFNNAAYQSGLGAAAVNPSAVNASAINQYMSPYQSDVVNSTAALLNQQDQIQQQQLTSSAVGSGAFGGDRSGLAAAALAGQQDLANNSTLANLQNQNYSQALSEANTQQSVGLGAAQANRAAVQQNAATLAGIGSAATTAGLGVAGAQLGAGELQQQTQQASDTAQYGQFLQQQAYPFQTEQYLANIVEGIAPNYGSETAGTTTTQTSPLNSIIGGAALAGGLAPSVSSIGSGLSSAASGLGSIFSLSDRRAKEDIRPAGALFDGQPIYTFRYKGSPVKELGLVAQDVEKTHPGAVAKGLGGLKMVNYEAATQASVDKGHFARGGRTLGDIRFHDLTPDEVAHLQDGPVGRATGGVVGSTPYSDVDSYVPYSQGLGGARMLTSPLPSTPTQPTNPIPNFQQFQQASQGLGSIGSGLGNAAGDIGEAASFLAKPINSVGTLNLATGGKVEGLGVPRAYDERYAHGLGAIRRGYDGGGVVSADDLVFDPNAVSAPQSVQPGLGALVATAPQSSSQGLGAAVVPPNAPPAMPSQGLGGVAPLQPSTPAVGLGAAVPSSNANAPAPTPAQSQGLGAAAPTAPAAPATGLGAIASVAPASADPLGGYMARTRALESGGNDSASSGSAFGRYQFTPSTWAGVARQHPELGLTSDGIGDPGQQEAAMRAFTADNSAALTKALGRAPTPQELYMAHQQGASGAIGLFSNPNARAADIVGQDAVTRNGGTPDMTAGQFTGMWASRFNGTGGVSGGMPSTALGYAGSGGLGGQPSQGLGGAQPTGPASNAYGTGLGAGLYPPEKKATGIASFLGFGPGGDGGLFGLSDNARQALLATGAAIMSSTSKSPGIAIGEGISKGLATNQAQQALDRDANLARAKAAGIGSEIQDRQAMQGIERDRVKIAGEELGAHLRQLQQEGQNYASEDAYRKGMIGNEALRVALERYKVIPGPDGSFRYLDQANPGRGLLTGAQVPELAAASGAAASASGGGGGVTPSSATPATTGAPASGFAAPSSAAPAEMNGPSSLKSDDFMRTGRPTLAAPKGYLPTNYWANTLRRQNDAVARESDEARSREDLLNSANATAKANNAVFYADQMDHNMTELSKSGMLKPGAAFPDRLNAAKAYNFGAQAIGLPTIDDTAIASGQSLMKDQTHLATELTGTLGNREAASVLALQMSATPGPSNTVAGYKAISSGMRVLAQRQIDKDQFLQDYHGRFTSTGEADTAFNKLNPPMVYARQAQALAKIPQDKIDLLRSYGSDPRAAARFDQAWGPGTSRYFMGS